jgi:hypothetical protein
MHRVHWSGLKRADAATIVVDLSRFASLRGSNASGVGSAVHCALLHGAKHAHFQFVASDDGVWRDPFAWVILPVIVLVAPVSTLDTASE